MSETSTSPASAESAAPVGDSSAPAVESPSSGVSDTNGAVESSEPSGGLAASTESKPTESISAELAGGQSSTNETPAASDFDLESWDGNISALPESLRGPIQYLHRQLEGGYTKKFQDLSDQKKSFETDKDSWNTKNNDWESEKETLISERNLLKTLLDGGEDPRVADLTTKTDEYKKQLAELQVEYDEYKKIVDADIETQAEAYATRFKAQHADIFESEEKRVQLGSLLQNGWTPEAGVKLVGQTEDVIALATELKEKGTPIEIAVEHALLRSGSTSRTPRPGAQLTSGAKSRNNPASISEHSINSSNSKDARLSAARSAMEWMQKQKR